MENLTLTHELIELVKYRKGVGDMYKAIGFHREAKKHYFRARVLAWEAERIFKEINA